MKLIRDPLRLVTFSFLVKILAGAALLGLPGMSTRPLPWLDLLFTSTSAVCVTGLTTLDISRDFTVAGQTVICLLIQAGGIGIITLWLFFLSSFSALTGSSYHLATLAIGERSVGRIRSILLSVALGTILVEAVGAGILYLGVMNEMTGWRAVGWAVFHSVSAFCNAGFSLQTDNLVPFADNAVVCLTIASLIVIGGIGYGVMAEVAARPKKITLHTQLVLLTTVALILGGFFALGVLEWDGQAMGDAGVGGRLMHLLFLSITPRTAGFNTLDLAALRPSTLFFIVGLMLVGASPGGTGGGFKTTPLAIVFMRFLSIVAGRENVRYGRWELGQYIIFRAIWIILLYLVIAGILSLALLVSDGGLPARRNPHGALGLIFELVSALGTVGLSTGVTPFLSATGKWLLIVAMFIGRIGPLTFAFAIGGKPRKSAVKFIEGDVGLG